MMFHAPRHTRHVLLGALLALGVTTLTGCPTATVDPAYKKLVKSQDRVPVSGELGPGDKFSLKVYHEPDISGDFTVSPDGTIQFPYVGSVSVIGKTCANIEIEITTGLRKGYLKDPYVSCTITEYNSKQIMILGDVKKPGSYPYKSHATIVHAIAMAGGFEIRAERNKINLTRLNGSSQFSVTVPVQEIVEGKQKNIKLLPGDIIFVPRSAL